jgi:hypothetical protein
MKAFTVLLIMTIGLAAEDKVIHIFTALCDNKNQGIVKVPADLGDGDNPKSNLYWGALYGIKTHFKKSADWQLLSSRAVNKTILERLVFKHKKEKVILIADAYRGRDIKQSMVDYFAALAGTYKCTEGKVNAGGKADLVIFCGHNGLMDFKIPVAKGNGGKDTMAFCCKSRPFFAERIKACGGKSLLLTNGFMAPEAYVINAAIQGWLLKESDIKIARRTAVEYNNYQKCGVKGAFGLFKP